MHLQIGWLVVLRINVDSAIFQPYLDLEAGDNQSLKIQVARPGIEPRSSCSASKELNHSATAAPCTYRKIYRNLLSITTKHHFYHNHEIKLSTIITTQHKICSEYCKWQKNKNIVSYVDLMKWLNLSCPNRTNTLWKKQIQTPSFTFKLLAWKWAGVF